MNERPRSRATIIAGVITVAAMLIVATIFLLISSPWDDLHPRLHKKTQSSTTRQY